jgi:hypothetical protein
MANQARNPNIEALNNIKIQISNVQNVLSSRASDPHVLHEGYQWKKPAFAYVTGQVS